MNIHSFTNRYSVASQLNDNDFEKVAKMGYTRVVNCRPDSEADDQPSSSELSIAAARAGIHLIHIPITGSNITAADVSEFVNLLESCEAPVLGFCRSGMRAAMLWALSETNSSEPEVIIDIAAEHGYDLSPFVSQFLTKPALVSNQ